MRGRPSRRRTLEALGATATTALAGCLGSGQLLSNGGESSQSGSGGASGTGESSPFHPVRETTGFDVDLAGRPVAGVDDAPVDIYYWGDFQCPFCKRFEDETLPKLLDQYVRTGKVRIAFLEMPVFGPASVTAARASRCVWRLVRDARPGAYKSWHDAVFAQQEKPQSGWLTESVLDEATRSVDLGPGQVDACLSDHGSDVDAMLRRSVRKGKRSAITATPGFVLFDRDAETKTTLVGAQPYPRFESELEALL